MKRMLSDAWIQVLGFVVLVSAALTAHGLLVIGSSGLAAKSVPRAPAPAGGGAPGESPSESPGERQAQAVSGLLSERGAPALAVGASAGALESGQSLGEALDRLAREKASPADAAPPEKTPEPSAQAPAPARGPERQTAAPAPAKAAPRPVLTGAGRLNGQATDFDCYVPPDLPGVKPRAAMGEADIFTGEAKRRRCRKTRKP